MNERTQAILIALAQHRVRQTTEETHGWRTQCSCGIIMDDILFETHQAGQVDLALSDSPRPFLVEFADGIRGEQQLLAESSLWEGK